MTRIAWLCLALLVVFGVSACSGHIPPRPLPELHIAGVSKVPGFDAFFKSLDGYSDALEQLTAYQPGGASQPGRVLLPFNGNLYSIGLDGKTPFTIHGNTGTLIDTCIDRPSVAPNGRWLLCSSNGGIIAFDLQTTSADNVQVTLTNDNRPRRPAFGPHSQRFVVSLSADKDCKLGVYASEPPYNSSRLVAGLLFPDLVEPGNTWGDGWVHACDMSDASWSPDGNWIAFIAGRPEAQVKDHLYALDLRTIVLPSEAATDPAKVITIRASAVKDLGPVIYIGDVGTNLTWPLVGDTVTMPEYNQLVNINLRTGDRSAILTVNDAEFCAASWTPDDTQLFFALCRPVHSNPDTRGPPPELYVYAPQGATR